MSAKRFTLLFVILLLLFAIALPAWGQDVAPDEPIDSAATVEAVEEAEAEFATQIAIDEMSIQETAAAVEGPEIVDVEAPVDEPPVIDDPVEEPPAIDTDDLMERGQVVAVELLLVFVVLLVVALVSVVLTALILIYRSLPKWAAAMVTPAIQEGTERAVSWAETNKQRILTNDDPDDDWIAGLWDVVLKWSTDKQAKFIEEARKKGIDMTFG